MSLVLTMTIRHLNVTISAQFLPWAENLCSRCLPQNLEVVHQLPSTGKESIVCVCEEYLWCGDSILKFIIVQEQQPIQLTDIFNCRGIFNVDTDLPRFISLI